jgi:ElaB/YqjD/DUF883 family membrane-anchored ribosome-binding protein
MADDQAGSVNGTNMSEDVQALKEDLAQLRADLGSLTGKAAHQAKVMGRERLEQMRHALAAAKAKGGAAVEGTQHQIEEHPWAAVAIAFGVGLVVGKLLLHRR